MDQPAQETCITVGRLAEALTRLADALVAGDLEGVLAAEPQLAHLSSVLAAPPPAPADHDMLRLAVLEARLALARCERLGAGLDTFVECSLAAQGRSLQYVRHGVAPAPVAGHALTARG